MKTFKFSEKCKWRFVEDMCFYDTSCENAFTFIDGGPLENKFRFCPYCGNEIKLTKPEAEKEGFNK
jgi:hypothetical protein